MGATIKVGMADLNVCKAPDAITTLGLGSCIGIAVYDPVTKIGGLAHIMLPDSTKIRNNSNIAKFADTGIEELIRKVTAAGNKERVEQIDPKQIPEGSVGYEIQKNLLHPSANNRSL